MQRNPWKQAHSANLTMMNKAWHPLLFNMTDCDVTAHTLQLSHTLPMTSATEITQHINAEAIRYAFQVWELLHSVCRRLHCFQRKRDDSAAARGEKATTALMIGTAICRFCCCGSPFDQPQKRQRGKRCRSWFCSDLSSLNYTAPRQQRTNRSMKRNSFGATPASKFDYPVNNVCDSRKQNMLYCDILLTISSILSYNWLYLAMRWNYQTARCLKAP